MVYLCVYHRYSCRGRLFVVYSVCMNMLDTVRLLVVYLCVYEHA